MTDDSPEQAQKALTIEMFKYAVMVRSLYVTALIEPARRQIGREHRIRPDDLLPFVSNNPFVPPGREQIFAQGFQKGFDRDFLACIHLLIPQIENSLRYILNQRGVITSSLSDGGIQEDLDLNRLLRMPELRAILGDDITFDLKGLLIEASGSNLRNKVAHGLVELNEFYSTESIYLWWLILRLCCFPILNAMGDGPNASEEKA